MKPLYDELHCYVRGAAGRAPTARTRCRAGEPIPAHLLGNMWAQEWANIYPLVEPYKGQAEPRRHRGARERRSGTPVQMVKPGERFFTSLGLDPLPKTFWERSMLTKPRDREVVCHASAWDVTMSDDLRIKMCIKPTEEDLITIHHELGHNYYYHAYYKLPVLFQAGANDGFHEAIGDALTLSITPAYLKKLGLLDAVPQGRQGPHQRADEGRAREGRVPAVRQADRPVALGRVRRARSRPADYNKAWWELRRKYQGVAPPVARTEEDFDPGAKYHVPANVPYTRYFLARMLQFQFHRALCQAAGHEGPLHQCSIYGNKEAGKRLKAMLAMGASKPWPEALEALTGERQIDATRAARVLRAAARLAQGAEQGPEVRLVDYKDMDMAGRYGMSFAVKLTEQGKYAEAIEEASRAVARDEEDPAPLVERAAAYAWLERYPEAVQDLEAALALDESAGVLETDVVDDAYFSALLGAAKAEAPASMEAAAKTLARYKGTLPGGRHLAMLTPGSNVCAAW